MGHATSPKNAPTSEDNWERFRTLRRLCPQRTGSTYVITSARYDGWAKIGRTADAYPVRRLATLQTGNPRPLVVRAAWRVDEEAIIHAAYDSFRGPTGEWFALPLPMIDYMGRLLASADPAEALWRRWPPMAILEAAGEETLRGPEIFARAFSHPE